MVKQVRVLGVESKSEGMTGSESGDDEDEVLLHMK